jgi:hypothetical protein
MYPFSPTAARTREIWLNTVSRVAGMVPPGSVQEATLLAFLPFNNVSRNARIPLNSSDEPAVSPLQRLLPNMRLTELFALGLGFCVVPVDNGVAQWGNAEFSSDPYSSLLSAPEQEAMRHLFLSTVAFDTNGTKRFDALNAGEFNINQEDGTKHSIKPRMLTATYTLVGGEPNVIEIAMPSIGDLTPLADSATRRIFICIRGCAINVVASTETAKQEVAARMRGGN